jgi:hypothetical protein
VMVVMSRAPDLLLPPLDLPALPAQSRHRRLV